MSTITVSAKLRGERRTKAVERAAARVRDDGLYFIRRHDSFFRPKAQGYTVELAAAAVYPGKEAKKYLGVEGLSLVPLKDMRRRVMMELGMHAAAVTGLSILVAKMEERRGH